MEDDNNSEYEDEDGEDDQLDSPSSDMVGFLKFKLWVIGEIVIAVC